MRNCLLSWGLTAVLGLLVPAGVLRADEEKVDLAKVPKAVLEAVKKKFPDAKLVGASSEKDGDKVVYEIELTNKEQKIDVTLTPEGKITLIEKVIPAKNLPKAVAAALEKKYPKATIKLAEEIFTGDDKLTKYEMIIETADKKTLEVCFEPEGKFLTEEEKKEAPKKSGEEESEDKDEKKGDKKGDDKKPDDKKGDDKKPEPKKGDEKKPDEKKPEVKKGEDKKPDEKFVKGKSITLVDAIMIAEKMGKGQAIKAEAKGEGANLSFKVELVVKGGDHQKIELDASGKIRSGDKKEDEKKPEPKKGENKKPEPKKGDEKKPEPKKGEDKKPEEKKPEPKKGEDKKPEPKRGEDKKPEPKKSEEKKGDEKSVKGKSITLVDAIMIAEKMGKGQAIKAEAKGEGANLSFKVELVVKGGDHQKIELDASGKIRSGDEKEDEKKGKKGEEDEKKGKKKEDDDDKDEKKGKKKEDDKDEKKGKKGEDDDKGQKGENKGENQDEKKGQKGDNDKDEKKGKNKKEDDDKDEKKGKK